MFSRNLDFIMNLTNTQASALGMACHLNPSHVSRLRNGTRRLPKKPTFLHDMCVYFARRITADYQKSAICSMLRLSVWPSEEQAAVELIEKWLSGVRDDTSADIAPLIASFAGARPETAVSSDGTPTLPKARSYYFGPSGKQEAVLQFFDLILKEKAPQTLCLASDEEMGWMYEDAAFSAAWLQRFTQVLKAGNRVRIVHSIGRNMNEMLEAVSKWLPVYTTGAVEPYFYPKLRDGIFQRTLFLAPNTAAVTSVSVNQRSEGRLNELITDREALAALKREYDDFLSLCRPLMQIITLPNRDDLWKVYNTLMSVSGDAICMSDRPTLATMPMWVAKAMQERAPASDILNQWRSISSSVKNPKDGGRYVEILPPDMSEEPPELPCADLLGAPGLRYTTEEWNAHLDRASGFRTSDRSFADTTSGGIPQNICLLAKEGRGVIMTKTNAPGVAFAISEPSMIHSFWGFLTRLV